MIHPRMIAKTNIKYQLEDLRANLEVAIALFLNVCHLAFKEKINPWK
jgi:hypothetical protein